MDIVLKYIDQQYLLQEKGEPDELYFYDIDILGLICMMVIVMGAMLVIMNSGEVSELELIKGLIGGLLIILAMFLYTQAIISSDFYRYYYFTTDFLIDIRWDAENVVIALSYGYYLALIGGIVSVGGSIISIIPILRGTPNDGE